MLRSRTSTSARSARVFITASGTVPASASTLSPGSASISRRSPLRTTAWSSAMITLVSSLIASQHAGGGGASIRSFPQAGAVGYRVRAMGPAERDVVLRDGTTMRLRPPVRDDAARRDRRSSRTSPTRAATCASTASRSRLRGWWSRCSTPTGSSEDRWRARSPTRPASGSSRWAATCGCATRRAPRSPSRSPTSSRARASARGCSSSSRRRPARSGSAASWPRCWRTTARCCASSRARASRSTREYESGVAEVTLAIEPTARLPRARRPP